MKSKAKHYKNIKWNPAAIKRQFKSGKNVSQIAQACGYPKNSGQNRVANLLRKAGLDWWPTQARFWLEWGMGEPNLSRER